MRGRPENAKGPAWRGARAVLLPFRASSGDPTLCRTPTTRLNGFSGWWAPIRRRS
jgi:hypothetical protein